MKIFLACVDLWGTHVSKQGATIENMEDKYGMTGNTILYDTNDLSPLLESIEKEKYSVTSSGGFFWVTMELRVSTTCNHDNVELGFLGNCGLHFADTCSTKWTEDLRIPKNVKNITITKTGLWNIPSGWTDYFSYKGKCDSNSLTIHKIQLVKGLQNCVENRMYINNLNISLNQT